MFFTDTHTHIYGEEFDEDRAAVVARAIENGVTRMLLPNIDMDSVEQMEQLAASNPEVFSMAMGLHPSEVYADYRTVLNFIKGKLFDAPDKYVAVGEIGIDLYWDTTFQDQQMLVFDEQVTWAETLNKPIIIHCRNGLDQILEVLGNHGKVRGVFHCFGGTIEDIERIRQVGDFYFGIGGVITFKKSTLPTVLATIGLERILLETDSPYLTPTPFRGKRNESSYIPLIAAKIAETLNVSVEAVGEQTSANASHLFGIQ